MSDAATKMPVTYEEYLRLERQEQEKHQWVDGEVFAMTGGTPEHARLQAAIARVLGVALLDRSCDVYSSDLRVRSRATNMATYADITVVCGPLETDPDDPDAVTNPTLIVEVLSPTTEGYDRGDKALHYRRIPSVQEYVLVAQDSRRIEVFRRLDDNGWKFIEAGAGETIRLESIACEIAVDEIYR